MIYWDFTVLTNSGQELKGTLWGRKSAVLKDLANKGYSFIQFEINFGKTMKKYLWERRVAVLAWAEFFEDFSNMLNTGMNLTQTLLVIKQTCGNGALVEILNVIELKIQDGYSLTESLITCDNIPSIVNVSIAAGEKSGRLKDVTYILGKYFRNLHLIKNSLAQALIYPIFVFLLLITIMFFISYRVLPQLKAILPEDAFQYQTTKWLFLMSQYSQKWGIVLIGVVIIMFLGLNLVKSKFHYRLQIFMYKLPLLGRVLKESAFALYFYNLSVLLKSGVGIIKAIDHLNSFEVNPVGVNFFKSKDYILGGVSFWQALERNKFFPSIVPYTLRRAEEMVKIDEYCCLLAEYFQKRVNSNAGVLLNIIQPILLLIGAAFLTVVALGFLIPVYGSLNTIAQGQ